MEKDIKLRDNEHIDVDYYVREARRLRSEYVAELGRVLGTKVKGLFHAAPSKSSEHHSA